MKKSSNKTSIIKLIFNLGLAIKAIDAIFECILGFLLMILNHEKLNQIIHFIAIPELKEDPRDIVINYLIRLGQNFSIESQQMVAIYTLFHGVTKLVVIRLLWKKKLWSYPIAIIVFGFFSAYEIYNFAHSPSVILLLFILIDITMIIVILLEYKNLKFKKEVS